MATNKDSYFLFTNKSRMPRLESKIADPSTVGYGYLSSTDSIHYLTDSTHYLVDIRVRQSDLLWELLG